MTTLTLSRHFKAPLQKVFDAVTRTEGLIGWWGPEGMTLPEHDLAFDRLGPWFSVMQNDAGEQFKVSGQVTHIDPPNSVGFTWAWHDEHDQRGVESHVTIRLVPAQTGGTDFTLTHVDLPDDDVAKNHEQGWTSSLRKLEALFN